MDIESYEAQALYDVALMEVMRFLPRGMAEHTPLALSTVRDLMCITWMEGVQWQQQRYNVEAPMKLQYETPRHCIEAVNQRVKQMGHGAGYRNDEKQVQCRLCRLWKYQDERCNLFEKKEGL